MTEPVIRRSGHRALAATAAVVAALALGGAALTGCSVINKINKINNAVRGNEATIDTFTGKLSATSSLAYEATYTTTTAGSAGTVTYAVQPPADLAFDFNPAIAGRSGGLGRTLVVANSSGAYSCALVPAPGSGWTCHKLGARADAMSNKLVAVYTPSHWVTFLQDFSIAAGFAGDKITTSAKTVNGFHLSCLDFRASGVPGTSTICITSQGVLGYLKAVTAAASFEIKSYSASPPASVFALPKGAKIKGAKGKG
jgi:outer membrane murein-binding lipoprotein Lpp